MSDREFYKEHLEKLIHVMRSPLATLGFASQTFSEFAKNNAHTLKQMKDHEDFETSLALIQSSIKRMNQHVQDIDNKMTELNKG